MKKTFTFWKSLFLLCALIVGTSTSWADEHYTITFTCTASSQSTLSTSTNASTVIANDGSRGYVTTQPFSTVTGSIFYGGSTAAEKKYLRMGATKKTADLTINLSDAGKVKATSIVVNCRYFNDNNMGTLSVNGMTAQAVPTTSSAGDLTFTFGSPTNITNISLSTTKATYVYSITVNYSTDTRTETSTTISVPDGFKTDLAGETNVAAGQLSAAVTYGSPATAVPSASVTWSSTNTDVATVDGSGNVTLKAVGTTTIKAQYEGTTTEYQPSEASYVLNVVNTYAKGQLHNPFTVAEALEFIAALGTGNTTGDDEYYTRGIVSYVDDEISSGKLNYGITADGVNDEDNCLNVYESKYLGNADFTTSNKLKVGDEVTVKGQLENYGSKNTPYSNNGYLISLQTKTTPTFTISPDEAQELDAYSHETVDITLTTNTDGDVTCESSNADVATVTLKSAGVYTITAQTKGTANITIKSAMSATYYPASKTIEVTVTDNRDDSGIAFANASVTKTWGESFTGQALTNEHSLPVTYSSTNKDVATVDADGVVTVLKAGTTTIKATFDGDATYFNKVVSYTLTINKAAAGLSYSPTLYEIDLNDDSFVAPTLNNPNSLSVTYGSNNTAVATVDENTGEITTLVTSAVGTATITASFAGNDNYNSGSTSYTIKVLDFNAPGGKNNPYTVAEVINGTASGSGVYVKAYIVGEYVGKTSAPRTTPTGDSNFALADEFTTSPVVANCIPAELKNSPVSIRNNWGLAKHPELIGSQILYRGNITKYFEVNGVKGAGADDISAVKIPVNVTSAGYATFSYINDLDFSGNEGLKVYYIGSTENNKASTTEITGKKVPANTGVIVKAAQGMYYGNAITDAPALDGTNLLTANTSKKTAADNGEFYIFANGGNGLGFYPIAQNTTLGGGKAYIAGDDVPAGAKNLVISFDGETTGIANLNVDETANFDANAPIYNLAGQRVTKSYKGVVIVNGKKMLNK